MTPTPITQLNTGDQIVHQHYGVGTIVGSDTHQINGEPTHYYRMQTADSTVWLPQTTVEDLPIRPISPPSFLDKAVEILERPARPMSQDKKLRAKRIKHVKEANDPHKTARLIRDLQSRRNKRKLYTNERKALQTFTTRLVREWAASKKVSVATAWQHFRLLVSLPLAKQSTVPSSKSYFDSKIRLNPTFAR